MERQKLLQYIDHFNHKRYDQVMEFYHPDVLIEYPTMLANPNAPPVAAEKDSLNNTWSSTNPAARPWKSKP